METVILIADDARLNREVLKLALASGGYRFIEAENGREAIERLKTDQVDLILLDLIMPVMDGFEFLKWRQDNPTYASIPVIANSALDDFDSIEIRVSPGQEFFNAGDVIFKQGSEEVLCLPGVSRPEPFRQVCLKTQSALHSVRAVLEEQAAGA